jgi:glyoxylase-like metal-dependent hydrolase (beta-lactamase superfamily II)
MTAPTIRLLEPAPGVLAFYAGRDGSKFADEDNWVDEGAIGLGIASYALLAGTDALVYDTGISVEWGQAVRAEVEARGAKRITVLLSHWHLDHVAGTQAFAGCEVFAGERTAAHLAAKREAIEAGELEGPPAIAPLGLPTRTFSGRTRLELGAGEGALAVEAIELNIHSDDAVVLWLPERRLLLAGDTMEDTVTFVDEPQNFVAHLRDLGHLRELGAERILPNHGDLETIGAGGYGPGLITATESYIRFLQEVGAGQRDAGGSLRDLVPELAGADSLVYFEPYEEIHRHNLGTLAAA